MSVSTKALAFFHHVAEKRDISILSKDLDLKESAIRRQLNLIEKEVQARLFFIKKQQIYLTNSGETLYKISKKIHHHQKMLGTSLPSAGDIKNRSYFNLHLSDEIFDLYLVKITQFLASLNPKMMLTINKGSFLDHPFDQGVDLALVTETTKMPDEFKKKNLLTTAQGLFASSAYLKKHELPQTYAELEHHALLGYENPASHWFLKGGFLHPDHLKICVNSEPFLARLIKEGYGLGPLTLINPEIEHYKLIRVLPTFKSPDLDLWAFHHPSLLDTSLFNSLTQQIQTLLLETPHGH